MFACSTNLLCHQKSLTETHWANKYKSLNEYLHNWVYHGVNVMPINPKNLGTYGKKTFLNIIYFQYFINFTVSVMITHISSWKWDHSEKEKGLCWWHSLRSWITSFHSRWGNLKTLCKACGEPISVFCHCVRPKTLHNISGIDYCTDRLLSVTISSP